MYIWNMILLIDHITYENMLVLINWYGYFHSGDRSAIATRNPASPNSSDQQRTTVTARPAKNPTMTRTSTSMPWPTWTWRGIWPCADAGWIAYMYIFCEPCTTTTWLCLYLHTYIIVYWYIYIYIHLHLIKDICIVYLYLHIQIYVHDQSLWSLWKVCEKIFILRLLSLMVVTGLGWSAWTAQKGEDV